MFGKLHNFKVICGSSNDSANFRLGTVLQVMIHSRSQNWKGEGKISFGPSEGSYPTLTCKERTMKSLSRAGQWP